MKKLSSEHLTFLLSLIAYLNDYREATVSELAQYFQYSEKEIRELIPRLTTYGVLGSEGYYMPEHLFDIDWDAFESDDLVFLHLPAGIGDVPKFSAAEATALIMGLQHLSNMPTLATPEILNELIEKLASGSSSEIRPPKIIIDQLLPEIELFRSAMSKQLKVNFEYVTAHGKNNVRTVAPLSLSSLNSIWYLRAHDFGAEQERTFRVDRMRSVAVTHEASGFAPREHSSSDLFDSNDLTGLHQVELRVGENAEHVLRAFQADKHGDNYTVALAHYDTIKRVIAAHAGAVQIFGPQDARTKVRHWAETALSQYE